MPPPKGFTKLQLLIVRERAYATLYDFLVETGMMQEVLDRLQDEFNITGDRYTLMNKASIGAYIADVERARELKPHPDYDEYCYDWRDK